jgi:glutathione synthase/RimK-type ligase-like ATP-grasp enzyme
LRHVESLLKGWPRPVLCAPDRIARLSRDGACRLLQSMPGVAMPLTLRIDRPELERLVRSDLQWPAIIRPVDSQKGHGLRKLDDAQALQGYLAASSGSAFHVAPYVDYRSPDGQFRKYRIVLIDGRPYACHMAISDCWVVHYMSAGMCENAAKRAEEAHFLCPF